METRGQHSEIWKTTLTGSVAHSLSLTCRRKDAEHTPIQTSRARCLPARLYYVDAALQDWVGQWAGRVLERLWRRIHSMRAAYADCRYLQSDGSNIALWTPIRRIVRPKLLPCSHRRRPRILLRLMPHWTKNGSMSGILPQRKKNILQAISVGTPHNVECSPLVCLAWLDDQRTVPDAESRCAWLLALESKALILRTNLGLAAPNTDHQYPRAIQEITVGRGRDPRFSHRALQTVVGLFGDRRKFPVPGRTRCGLGALDFHH